MSLVREMVLVIVPGPKLVLCIDTVFKYLACAEIGKLQVSSLESDYHLNEPNK